MVFAVSFRRWNVGIDSIVVNANILLKSSITWSTPPNGAKFYCPEAAEEFSPGFQPLSFIHKSENGEYLNSIALWYEWKQPMLLSLCYFTPSCRHGGPAVMVLPHIFELSLDAPKSM
jgi:hypothetical protein